MPSLTKTSIGDVLIPVPPYQEQKRIVSKIDTVLDTISNNGELINSPLLHLIEQRGCELHRQFVFALSMEVMEITIHQYALY